MTGFIHAEASEFFRCNTNHQEMSTHFKLSRQYHTKLLTYLSQPSVYGLVSEWIFNSSSFHGDDELSGMLDEVIHRAPRLRRRDTLVRVVRRREHTPPKGDRIVACSYIWDPDIRKSWMLAWGQTAAERWKGSVVHCCLLELNVKANVPRLYCISAGEHVTDHQSEVLLPLGSSYVQTNERIETWWLKRVEEHRAPVRTRMYYKEATEGAHDVRIDVCILTYEVS